MHALSACSHSFCPYQQGYYWNSNGVLQTGNTTIHSIAVALIILLHKLVSARAILVDKFDMFPFPLPFS